MKKQFIANFALVLFSLVFALLASEASLRVIDMLKKKPVQLVQDDILKHHAVPNTDWNGDGMYVWDANGFRNPEAKKKVDVIAFGDSTTVGYYFPVEKSWPQQFEKLTGKITYQMALPNYSIVQYSALLDKALEMDPDTVIVGFYMGNDLYDTYEMVYTNENWKRLRSTSTEYAAAKEEILQRDKELNELNFKLAYKDDAASKSRVLKIRIWLRDHLKVYALIADASYNIRVKLGMAKSQTDKASDLSEANPGISFYYDDPDIRTILSPSYRLDSVDLSGKIGKEGFRITKELAMEMNEKLKAKNKKLVFMIIPTKEVVYGNYMKAKGEKYTKELGYNISVSNELIKQIKEFCNDKKIPYIDTTPYFVNALDKKIKVFPETTNSHPTDLGNEVIANAANDYFKNN